MIYLGFYIVEKIKGEKKVFKGVIFEVEFRVIYFNFVYYSRI